MARKTNMVLSAKDKAIICKENKQLKENFINYLKGTDHAPSTIDVYDNNLDIFFIIVAKYFKNKDFCKIKKKDIVKLQEIMLSNDLSPSRIRGVKSSVSSLSDYCESMLAEDIDEDEDDPDTLKWKGFRNIVNKVPAPKLEKVREKTVLSEEECEKLLDTLVKDKKYQLACAFALAYATGRRKAELLRIPKNFIDNKYLTFGCLYKSPVKIKTKGSGKRGKMLWCWIYKPKFQKYFDLWMEERKRLGVPDDMQDLFITRNREGIWRPVKEATLTRWADKFTKMLNKDFYFHCLRHNFVTFLVKSNVPVKVIQEIIGWSSVEMVSVYTDLNLEDKLGDYFTQNGINKNIKSENIFKS